MQKEVRARSSTICWWNPLFVFGMRAGHCAAGDLRPPPYPRNAL